MRRFISYTLQEKLLQGTIRDAKMAGARTTNGIRYVDVWSQNLK